MRIDLVEVQVTVTWNDAEGSGTPKLPPRGLDVVHHRGPNGVPGFGVRPTSRDAVPGSSPGQSFFFFVQPQNTYRG